MERPRPAVRPACPPRRADRRLVVLTVVLALGFGAVLVRLVEVQGVSASRYAVLGDSQRLHAIELPAQRGSILDRNGKPLAVSVQRSTVWADPHQVTDAAGAARALAPVLGMSVEDLLDRLTTNARFVYLARRVDDTTATAVTDLKLDGVALLEEPTRVWPAGDVGASVLGDVGVENTGLSGLEQQFEKLLAGTPGELVVERDPSGRDIPGGVRQSRPPVRGKDLVLTLDRDLQFMTEQALSEQIVESKAKAGIAVVMDPRTGEVLAMANTVAGAKGEPPRSSGYNKALIDVYEPGSVNKVVTLAAAVEEGAIAPGDWLSVPDKLTVAGTTFYDSESHAVSQWRPREVMAHSSNAGAILIAQRLGPAGLDRYLHSFLGGDTGLGFPGEASGIVPGLEEWSGTSLPTLAIGYGLAVTPLQMLNAYNTIANGGVSVTPSLVLKPRPKTGSENHTAKNHTPTNHRVVSAETARTVTDMLVEVVRSGTGQPAAVGGYTVAGKTGTARKADGTGYVEGAYNATFAGFLPAESPKLSAIVVLDEPQPYYGGLSSGPVFAELAAYAVRHYQVPSRPPGTSGPELAAATLRPSSATRP